MLYQEVSIAPFQTPKELRRLTPRRRADLPENIAGQAEWMQPDASANNRRIPPSYHAINSHGVYYPVEYVNNQWYWLEWDDSDDYFGYWIRPQGLMAQGEAGLGWDGRTYDVPTPQAIQGPSFVEARERAESSSTQPEASEKGQLEDDDDPVDKDPVHTAALAALFEENPVFEDVAEAVDAPEDRTHYLPTILPSAAKMQPVSLNPIRVRSTSTGGEAATAAATQDATRLITNAVKIDGQLKGRVPETFDGDRTQAQKFANAFELFWMTNDENSTMKVPYKRCTYFLGLMSGTKVDDWVIDQARILHDKVTRTDNRIPRTEESLWNDLRKNFGKAFTNTNEIEQARTDLNKLEMAGEQIDEYIAKFENLLRKADIPRTETGAIEKFKDGLKRGIFGAIMKRDIWPSNIDEWEEAARREVRRYSIIKEAMGTRGNPFMSTRQSRWMEALKKTKPRKDEAVPMDIDLARLEEISTAKTRHFPQKNKDQERMKKEGLCFGCQQKGHLRRDCPKGKGPRSKAQPKAEGRVAAVEADNSKVEGSPPDLARQIRSLDDEGRENLLTTLLENPDF